MDRWVYTAYVPPDQSQILFPRYIDCFLVQWPDLTIIKNIHGKSESKRHFEKNQRSLDQIS